MEQEKTEVVYKKAKPGRRMLGHLIDIGMFLIFGVILFTAFNELIKATDFYKGKSNDLAVLRSETKLYVNNEKITTYVDNNSKFPNIEDKKNFLRESIDDFYSNPTYFKTSTKHIEKYNKRKLAKPQLFEQVGEDVVEKEGANVNKLLSFYKTEVNDYALSYLFNNIHYIELTRFVFLAILFEIITSIVLSFFVFYYVFPAFIFRRGRQTIGMKLLKYGLITVHADNQGLGIYSLRTLFMFFIYIPINFVSFFLPTFLSLGMMFFSKTNCSLANYVFNDYMVDVTDQEIYLNDLERIEAQEALKSISIESKDFTLKQFFTPLHTRISYI